MGELKRLDNYGGRTVEQLLSLSNEYQSDSLVFALEEVLYKKATNFGLSVLTDEELIVLAVVAVDREVNNGGFSAFFCNPTGVFVSTVVRALDRVGCTQTAQIVQRAIDALGPVELKADVIEAVVLEEDAAREAVFEQCDTLFFGYPEDILAHVFDFVSANAHAIRI